MRVDISIALKEERLRDNTARLEGECDFSDR